MLAEPLRNLAVPLDELKPLEGNPRRGDVAAVARSLKRFGQRKPIVARADGTVVAGNHTLAAARELGWAELAVVRVDDDEATAKAYALADNRTSALGSFDEADLAAMVGEVFAADPELLAAASFDEADLNELLAGLGAPATLNDPDEVPDPPAEPVSALGDLWLLGPHRLLCGDSTNEDEFGHLMEGNLADMIWTDPPYNVAVTGGTHDPRDKKNYSKGPRIINDAMDDGEFRTFLIAAFSAMAENLKPGGAAYACHADTEGLNFRSAFGEGGLELHQVLIWVKQQFVFGRSDYHWQHEPILYGWRPGAAHVFHGERNQSTVWQMDRPMRSAMEHPTQKPVTLISIALANSSRSGATVLDPFAGSGSTLIACHGTGRRARLLELDPAYVDVICRRFQEHTGMVPVLEATGKPHDFTS